MGAKSHLSAVPPNSRAKRSEPKSISEALSGSGTDVLVAMRRALAQKLDAGEVSSNAIASAYKELRELDRLIRLAEREARRDDETHDDVDSTFDASAI